MENRMNLIFSFKDEAEYLSADLSGEWDLEDLKGFARAVLSRVKDSGYKRILIDATKTNTKPDTSASFFYGEYVSTMFQGIKIALVMREEFISGLFEDVAVNRGAFLSVFKDRPGALQWLLSSNSSKE